MWAGKLCTIPCPMISYPKAFLALPQAPKSQQLSMRVSHLYYSDWVFRLRTCYMLVSKQPLELFATSFLETKFHLLINTLIKVLLNCLMCALMIIPRWLGSLPWKNQFVKSKSILPLTLREHPRPPPPCLHLALTLIPDSRPTKPQLPVVYTAPPRSSTHTALSSQGLHRVPLANKYL